MRFRALHESGELFVMPNPWDVASGRVLVELGFPALATSSAAVARDILGVPNSEGRCSRVSGIKRRVGSVCAVQARSDQRCQGQRENRVDCDSANDERD